MGKVIFLMNVSLDGYVETPDHSLDWTIVDDELLAWFNERTRSFEAIVYGRRLYELMNAYWPTAESDPAATGPMVEFARIWNAKPKVVVSSSMQEHRPAGASRAAIRRRSSRSSGGTSAATSRSAGRHSPPA